MTWLSQTKLDDRVELDPTIYWLTGIVLTQLGRLPSLSQLGESETNENEFSKLVGCCQSRGVPKSKLHLKRVLKSIYAYILILESFGMN